MVQLRTLRFTVFKWTIRFNRTIRVDTVIEYAIKQVDCKMTSDII